MESINYYNIIAISDEGTHILCGKCNEISLNGDYSLTDSVTLLGCKNCGPFVWCHNYDNHECCPITELTEEEIKSLKLQEHLISENLQELLSKKCYLDISYDNDYEVLLSNGPFIMRPMKLEFLRPCSKVFYKKEDKEIIIHEYNNHENKIQYITFTENDLETINYDEMQYFMCIASCQECCRSKVCTVASPIFEM